MKPITTQMLLELVQQVGTAKSARLLGCSYSTVYRWTTRQSRPPFVSAKYLFLKKEAAK